MACLASPNYSYRKTSNISRTLVGNNIFDNSDVVGASPVGTAPTISSFSTNTWLQWIEWSNNMTVWILAGNYISFAIAAGLIRLHMPGVKKSRV